VIVPVFNAERVLPRLMASLRSQTYPRDRVEVLLVDNNSTDGSAGVMRDLGEVVCLSQTRHQTPGATRNAGIRHATGEIIAFIDADCWAHPGWLRAGVGFLTERDLDRVAGQVVFVLSAYPNIYEIYDSSVNFRQADFVASGWCGTGNLFVRRDVFEDVGLFDPVLRSHEDLEFGVRASRRGKSLGYDPDALAYHETRKSLKGLVRKWIRSEYGAGQVHRRHGLLDLHLWYKKANYRPLVGVWRDLPEAAQQNARVRFAMDGIANILRAAGNVGNFLGYFELGRRTGPTPVPPPTRR